jgi:N6-adenosine-specific RNA methylase IME4
MRSMQIPIPTKIRQDTKSMHKMQTIRETKKGDNINLPNKKKYNIIYADPPWNYTQFTHQNHGAAKAHYNTMTLEELKALPVQKLADDNCALFIWATFPQLQEAIELIKNWGFRYITAAFVWIKTNPEENYLDKPSKFYHGLGFHTASNVEIVLLGKKGVLERKDKRVKQIIVGNVRKHSQKPEETYTRIERLYGNLPKIELFARYRRENWDVWGLEAPKETQKILRGEENGR